MITWLPSQLALFFDRFDCLLSPSKLSWSLNMFSRPGPGDTEKDLLKSQEEFIAGRLNPSAVVCRSSRPDEQSSATAGEKREHATREVERDVVTLDGLPPVQPSKTSSPGFPPKKKSRFKDRHNKNQTNRRQGEEDIDTAELLGVHDRHVSTVLSKIKERNIQGGSVMLPQVAERGFPKALHRGDMIGLQSSSNNRDAEPRQSVFAQQFAVAGGLTFGLPEHRNNGVKNTPHRDEDMKTDRRKTEFDKSLLITGEGLNQQTAGRQMPAGKVVEEIHQENVAKLASMSQEEIKEEQERIRASLDPSLVAFLTSRHNKSDTKQTEETGPGEEKVISHRGEDSASQEGSHVGKHVHFSEDIEMISQDSEENMTADQCDDGSMNIGGLKVSEGWLHMSSVESGKLEWMKDCPTPRAVKSKEGQQARFDFNGHLVSKTEDIPEYLGLHHHGDNPSSAGYTLEELLILARSTFLQQRVLALQVLARIIRQDHEGVFQDCLLGDVLTVLLDAGVLFLLRWSLDDSSDAVLAAAVQGFSAILTVPRDNEEAEKVLSFPRGLELPALRHFTEKKERQKSQEDDEEEHNLTDAELLRQDVVQGLIQMSLLPRLRYILEVCRPAAPTVLDILAILTRISQHSTQTASEVFRCPRMLETIMSNFLPLSWKASESGNCEVYHQPVSNAMRLMRALCSAGRNMAAILIAKYDLIGRVMRYTALDPPDMQMGIEEAYSLYIESLRTWRVCILYGLSCDTVREMYSTFTRHLQAIQSLSVSLMSTPKEKSQLSCAAAIFGVIEAGIHAAGTVTAGQTTQAGASTPEEHHGIDSPPSLSLNWSHVTGFLPMIGGCVAKWINEILDSDDPRFEDENLILISGSFAVLTSFYFHLQGQASYSPVDTLQQVEQLVDSVLLPLVESNVPDTCFKHIISRSIYSNSTQSKLFSKNIPSLPNYGSVKMITETGAQAKEPNVSVLVGFVTSMMQLLCQVTQLHKGVASKFTFLLCKETILRYLNFVLEAVDTPQSFFAREEHHLQYFLVKLVHNVIEVTGADEVSSYLPLWHEVSLCLFSSLFPGDEFYAHDLLSTVLFNSKFFVRGNDPLSVGVTRDLSQMSLATEACPTPPLPTTSDITALDRGEVICEAHKSLHRMRTTFMDTFQDMKDSLGASRSLSLHQVRNIKSFLLPPCSGPLQPADWMFRPIVDLYNQAFSVEMKGNEVDSVIGPAVSIVTTTLQLVLMLEEWRPSRLRHVSMTARVARLMCVFLTGNDLFLDSSVHNCLSSLLRIYSRPPNLSKLDFNSAIPGLTSFYDLYASLLSQYSAVSFGDALFACFVVLPLTQRHDPKFRRAVWDEHIGVLRALSLPLDQLPVSLDEFLYPVEQSDSLLALYLRALATQTVRPQWSPLFYLIAVHHVNAFIFQRADPEDSSGIVRKLTLLKQVLAIKNESVRHDVLYYYKPAPVETSRLLERFTNLPPDREMLLRHRDSLEECRQMYHTMSAT